MDNPDKMKNLDKMQNLDNLDYVDKLRQNGTQWTTLNKVRQYGQKGKSGKIGHK